MKILDKLSQQQISMIIFVAVMINVGCLWLWEDYYYKTKTTINQKIVYWQQQSDKSSSIQNFGQQSRQLLTQQIAQTQRRLSIAEKQIVSANQTVDLIKKVTSSFPGITIVSLQNAHDNKKTITGNLYQHNFTLIVTGDYSSVNRYLNYLETLPWQLGWTSIDYQVSVYPQAKVTVSFYIYSPQGLLING